MKSSGTCLCGKITWKINGEPDAAYHCHCSMCRKAHGAAFATYYFIKAAAFKWSSELDSLVEYESSADLTRTFCGECGSVVPDADQGSQFYYVPAGSHTDGPPISTHIMVGSKAPWYEIADALKQYETYPPQETMTVYPDKSLPAATEGVVRGSCLCGAVEFCVLETFKVIHNCHCFRCRRARAAAFTTNGFVSSDCVQYGKGEDQVSHYKMPEAKYFTHAFCNVCGSGLPRIDNQRKIAVIPLGALDDDPVERPADHIFTANKADWFEICDTLLTFKAMPK
ncbi:MAG: GFA family protein [bacterium]